MTSEFSIPINIHKLPRRGVSIYRSVDKETCSKIASRVEVDAVEEFSINISVRHEYQPITKAFVEGSIKATVIQCCSVTLEPIISNLSIPIALIFIEANSENLFYEDLDLERPDPPETMRSGYFDIGDILVQVLAVEVDPFPRKSGSSLQDIPAAKTYSGDNLAESNTSHPFAKLAEIRDKLEEK